MIIRERKAKKKCQAGLKNLKKKFIKFNIIRLG